MYLNDRYRNFVLFLITKAQSQNTTKEQGNRSKQNKKKRNREQANQEQKRKKRSNTPIETTDSATPANFASLLAVDAACTLFDVVAVEVWESFEASAGPMLVLVVTAFDLARPSFAISLICLPT